MVLTFNDLPYGVAIPSKELNLLMSHHYGAELFDLSADRPFISKVDPSQYNNPHQLFTSEREFLLAALLRDPSLVTSFQSCQDLFAIKTPVASIRQKQFFNELSNKLKDLPVCEKTLKEIRTFLEKQREMKTAQNIQIIMQK